MNLNEIASTIYSQSDEKFQASINTVYTNFIIIFFSAKDVEQFQEHNLVFVTAGIFYFRGSFTYFLC